MRQTPLPPHPKLDPYYASNAERPKFVSDMFDDGAPYYERICRVMSLGTGEDYRRQTLLNAGLEKGMRVLDVATGTGLVLRAASELSGATSFAIGLDPSSGMLLECRKRCAATFFRSGTVTRMSWLSSASVSSVLRKPTGST